LLNKEVYSYTTSGKPLTTKEYKKHLSEIIKASDAGEIGYSTDQARKKIVKK
jgi:hypothetical protein